MRKKHNCPKCDKQEVVWDIAIRRFYCLSCDKQYTKQELVEQSFYKLCLDIAREADYNEVALIVRKNGTYIEWIEGLENAVGGFNVTDLFNKLRHADTFDMFKGLYSVEVKR